MHQVTMDEEDLACASGAQYSLSLSTVVRISTFHLAGPGWPLITESSFGCNSDGAINRGTYLFSLSVGLGTTRKRKEKDPL